MLLLSLRLLLGQTVAIQDSADPLRARLSGIVLNEQGQPAANVTVQATPPGPIFGILPHTQTDAEGQFAFAGLLPGHTYVNALNEEAFYPDASSNFWDREGAAEVELPVAKEVSGVVLTLKPVSRLEVKARNAETGADIDQIYIRLERDGAPNRSIGGGRLGNWWLAPTAPIRLCVSAKGFEANWYGGDGSFSRSTPITLMPRQAFTAIVSLRPIALPTSVTNCFTSQN